MLGRETGIGDLESQFKAATMCWRRGLMSI